LGPTARQRNPKEKHDPRGERNKIPYGLVLPVMIPRREPPDEPDRALSLR